MAKVRLRPSNRQPAVHPQLFSGEREEEQGNRVLGGGGEETEGERGGGRGKKQMTQDEHGRKGKGGDERKERVQTLKPWDTFVNC